jgi:hypothetical protein
VAKERAQAMIAARHPTLMSYAMGQLGAWSTIRSTSSSFTDREIVQMPIIQARLHDDARTDVEAAG